MARFLTLFLLFVTLFILASTYVLGFIRRLFGRSAQRTRVRSSDFSEPADVVYKSEDVEVLRGHARNVQGSHSDRNRIAP